MKLELTTIHTVWTKTLISFTKKTFTFLSDLGKDLISFIRNEHWA